MRRFVLLVSASLFSSILFAASALEDLDANKDGSISAEEAQAQADLAKDFNLLDRNQDGKLDAAEFAQFEAIPATDEEKMPEISGEMPAAK